MAVKPNITDEEIQLRKRARRRLVGAIALVVAMAAILPMVLDSEPKPVGQDIAITIPSQQSGDFNSKIAPATNAPEPAKPASPPPPVAAAAPAQPETPPPAPPAAQKQPEKPADTPADKPAEKSAIDKPAAAKPAEHAREAKPAVAKNVPHKGGGFIVLLGAFSSEANAKQRQTKLKELGVKFHVETVKTPAGDKIGVRAGPYASRAEAERARDKLKAAGIPDGVVAEKK